LQGLFFRGVKSRLQILPRVGIFEDRSKKPPHFYCYFLSPAIGAIDCVIITKWTGRTFQGIRRRMFGSGHASDIVKAVSCCMSHRGNWTAPHERFVAAFIRSVFYLPWCMMILRCTCFNSLSVSRHCDLRVSSSSKQRVVHRNCFRQCRYLTHKPVNTVTRARNRRG